MTLAMAGMIGKGTQSTLSQVLVLGIAARSSSTKGLASEASLFIFQLPAITVLRYFLFMANAPYLSSRQATPGSSRPSRNSREAPPPVLMWVILSA